MTSGDLALILTGVLLNAIAQLLLKIGAGRIADVEFTLANARLLAERVIINGPILLGLVCYGISVIVWILALSRVKVSIAYPMLSIGYVVTALAAWLFLSEHMTGSRLAGIGVIICGCWLVART